MVAKPFTVHAGPFAYEVLITCGPLSDAAGNTIVGEAQWDERRILISGAIDPTLREQVLMHEVREVWEFHLPRPTDLEKQRDWDATVQTAFNDDYQKFGGREALLAMAGTVEPSTSATRSPAGRLGALRRHRFGELSDDQFDQAKVLWELRGLDPFSEDFYAQPYVRENKPMLRLVMNIEGLRKRAHATGVYAGLDEAKYEYIEGRPHPVKCVVTVYKLVGGERCPFAGEARFDDYYGKSINDVAAQHPHACIARCAEAIALRRAFPEKLSGLHVPEEFPVKRAQKQLPRKTGTGEQAIGRPVEEVIGTETSASRWDKEPTPRSAAELEQTLGRMGLSVSERRELIQSSIDPDCQVDDDPGLFERVFEKAKERLAVGV